MQIILTTAAKAIKIVITLLCCDMVFKHSRDTTILIVLAAVVCSYDCAFLQLVSVYFHQSTTVPTLANFWLAEGISIASRKFS